MLTDKPQIFTFKVHAKARDLSLHLSHYVFQYGNFFTINKPCQ